MHECNCVDSGSVTSACLYCDHSLSSLLWLLLLFLFLHFFPFLLWLLLLLVDVSPNHLSFSRLHQSLSLRVLKDISGLSEMARLFQVDRTKPGFCECPPLKNCEKGAVFKISQIKKAHYLGLIKEFDVGS